MMQIEVFSPVATKGDLRIYDVNGEVLYEKLNLETDAQNLLKVETRVFSTGLHFVEWQGNKYPQTEKLPIIR